MFFNTLKREIVALNLVNLMFFVTVFSYLRFSSDLYMNGMAFSVIKNMKPVVYPFSFFYFILCDVIFAQAICRLFRLQCRKKHYFMIFISGVVYAFFYLSIVIVVYALFMESLTFFAKYALTELPFWIVTITSSIFLFLLLKILTLTKIVIRLYFFSMTDSKDTETHWIRQALGELKNKRVYIRFFIMVLVAAGIPFIISISGFVLSNLFLSVLSLLCAVFFYSTGKLASIYLLWGSIFSHGEESETAEEVVEA